MSGDQGKSFLAAEPVRALQFLNHAHAKCRFSATSAQLSETANGTINPLVVLCWYLSHEAGNPCRAPRGNMTSLGVRVDIHQSHSPLGRVLSVSGSQAQVRLAASAQDVRATVGKFLGIHAGKAIVVGVITKIVTETQAREEGATATVDMLGEIKRDERREFFQRGVTEYPMIGDGTDMITQDQL